MLISVLGNETLSPGKWQQQFKVGLGLDLSSGTEVVLQAETHDGSPPASGEMQQAISVLQSRVNGTGNSGAQVQQQGSDMINVTVPGTPSYNVVSLVTPGLPDERPAGVPRGAVRPAISDESEPRSATATRPSSTPPP